METKNENFLNKMLEKWQKEINNQKEYLINYNIELEALITFFTSNNINLKYTDRIKYDKLTNLIEFKRHLIKLTENEIKDYQEKIKQITICLTK